jgi:hypothetical protein
LRKRAPGRHDSILLNGAAPKEAKMLLKSILVASAAAMLAASTSLAHAAVTQLAAGQGAKRLVIQTEDTARAFTNPFLTVTSTKVFGIPSTQTGFLVATFTGESQCSARDWCSIDLTCDSGILLDPAAADDFAFNSPGGATFASYTVTGRSKPFTDGNHFCTVNSVAVGGGSQTLDDWVFTVEFWQQ